MLLRNTIHIQKYQSPCGVLLLGSFDDKLCLCDWEAGHHRELTDRRLQKALNAEYKEAVDDTLREAAAQLDAYFKGEATQFSVPLLFVGSEFQQSVWQRLLEIPYGTTVSYGELAKRLSSPTAVRAVANANGANAISIFVPCHRVVGSDRSLTGYGGGLDVKRFLLEMEARSTSLF